MSGKLYLVPTPIGHLEDITLRGIRILKEVDFIMAEDTRSSSVLLKHYDISKPVYAHHKFNEHKSLPGVIDRLIKGESAALITDAGTPGLSDPGYLLVRACIDHGMGVEVLPGASALIPAIVLSGLPSDRFVFEGFLPVKKGRNKRMTELAMEERTMIFYESPFRLVKTLDQLSTLLGSDRRAAVCRELSKIHEEVMRGTLTTLSAWYSQRSPRGEIVLVVAGSKDKGDQSSDES